MNRNEKIIVCFLLLVTFAVYCFTREQSVFETTVDAMERSIPFLAFANQVATADNMPVEDEQTTESVFPEEDGQTQSAAAASVGSQAAVNEEAEAVEASAMQDDSYLLGDYFIIDPNTTAESVSLKADTLLGADLRMEQTPDVPQILIYHTHTSEEYSDSNPDDPSTTVVGVGDYLTQILSQYGYQVIHDTTVYDLIGGELDRNRAYQNARAGIEQILQENPSIEVIIDLHRDGVDADRHLVTQVNGQDTAQLLFFNGLSYTNQSGALTNLENPYRDQNLAFSTQLRLRLQVYYKGLSRGIYLKGYRYNLHLRPRSLLLEVGAQNNTLQEAKNAMPPFADVLNKVLKGE